VGAGDGPPFAVTHRVTGGGDQATVVAAGRHKVTETGVFAAADRHRCVGIEVTGGDPGGLHRGVQPVDVLVGRRHQRHGAAAIVVFDPLFADPGEMLIDGAGADPAVDLVGVQAAGITNTQLE
jgi:hypothetical protein